MQTSTAVLKENIIIKAKPTDEPVWIKIILIGITLLFMGIFLVLTLVLIFQQAFQSGFAAYFKAISESEALSSIKLTLLTTFVSVTLNTVFGVCAAWAIAKFSFRGKSFLITLLDLPYTISPVISGMMFVLLLGANSFIGEMFSSIGIKIIFAVPGIIIATTFVTFPYVARELIPHMAEQGNEEEEAALALCARGFKTFFKITLPNIKWSLLYGVIICNARAIGEFGAVSVVSGHIRGLTNTMPLHIEILYNEYAIIDSFAIASLLTILAIVTLIIKSWLEWNTSVKIKNASKGNTL